MRLLLLLFCATAFAQVSLRQAGSATTADEFKLTELARDSRGVLVRIEGEVDGQFVRTEVRVVSAVTEVSVGGKKLSLYYQRPIPLVRPLGQFCAEMVAAMMDRIAIRNHREKQEASRLGFESAAKMKQFTGQNRSRIAQAAKNGSSDPVADVKAQADAKRAYLASAEQQDPNVRNVYAEIRMKMQGAFQVAQAPIYKSQEKAPEADQLEYAAVCEGIEELRRRLVASGCRVLRTGDLTVDENNQAELARIMGFLRSTKVKTEPPFTRGDINETQKIVDRLKAAMALPLSH